MKELAIGHPEDMLGGVGPLHAELHSPIVLHDEEVDDWLCIDVLEELLVVDLGLLLCAALSAESDDSQIQLARRMDRARTLTVSLMMDIFKELLVDRGEYSLEGLDRVWFSIGSHLFLLIRLWEQWLLQDVHS